MYGATGDPPRPALQARPPGSDIREVGAASPGNLLIPYRLRIVAFGVQATAFFVLIGVLFLVLPGHGAVVRLPWKSLLRGGGRSTMQRNPYQPVGLGLSPKWGAY